MTSLPVVCAQVPGCTALVFLQLGALPVVLGVQRPGTPRQRRHGNRPPIRRQGAHLYPFFCPPTRDEALVPPPVFCSDKTVALSKTLRDMLQRGRIIARSYILLLFFIFSSKPISQFPPCPNEFRFIDPWINRSTVSMKSVKTSALLSLNKFQYVYY